MIPGLFTYVVCTSWMFAVGIYLVLYFPLFPLNYPSWEICCSLGWQQGHVVRSVDSGACLGLNPKSATF